MRATGSGIVIVALVAACGVSKAAPPAVPPQEERAAVERAVAFGLLLDSPRSGTVVSTAVEIADRLRQRYGIDTGDVLADRREAARRAQAEVLDKLTFTEEQLAAAARGLGLSLDRRRCGNTCTHVRALAMIELQKRALRTFAAGRGSGPAPPVENARRRAPPFREAPVP